MDCWCLCLHKIQIIHSKWIHIQIHVDVSAFRSKYYAIRMCNALSFRMAGFLCLLHIFFCFKPLRRFFVIARLVVVFVVVHYGLYLQDSDRSACLSDANINKHKAKMKNETANNNGNRLKTDLSMCARGNRSTKPSQFTLSFLLNGPKNNASTNTNTTGVRAHTHLMRLEWPIEYFCSSSFRTLFRTHRKRLMQ